VGAVEEPAGEDGRGGGDGEAGEVLEGGERGDVMRGADGLGVAPTGGSGEVDEEEGHADARDGSEGRRAAGDDDRAGGGEGHAGDKEGAVDGVERKVAADEAVGKKAAPEHAGGAEEEGDGGDPAGAGEREMTGDLEVAGDPGGVEPVGVVDAAEAEHHAPDGASAEEMRPGRAGGGGGGAVRLAMNGLVAGAIEREPGGGESETSGTEKDEHRSPADAEDEDRKDGRGDGEADGLGGAHEGGGAGAGGGWEPFADGLDAGGVERGLPDAEQNAEGEEWLETGDEAGEQLGGGPESKAGAEHGSGAGAGEKGDERELREAVGEGEGGEEPADLGAAEMKVGADGGVGDGE